MSALLGAEKGIQMINVELNDVLDVVLNIPNATYSLYFMAKACSVKFKRTYIFFTLFIMSVLTFLQDIELMSKEAHLITACLILILGIQLFISEKRFSSLQFCGLIYLSLVLCESVLYIICLTVFGESMLILITETKNIIFIKIYFLIVSFTMEYAIYKFWINKMDKKSECFNKQILVLLLFELVVAWWTLWLSHNELHNSNAAYVLLLSVIFTFSINIMQFIIGEQDIRKQSELVKANILREQLANQNSRKSELEEHINKANEAKAYILENVDKAAALLVSRQGEAAHEQLQGIVDTIAVKYMYSNNKIADALLSDKAKLCEEYGIELKCRLDFPDNMPIDNARLCIVLSNLIDNAIRACSESTEGSTAEHKPFISLKVNEQFGYLVIRQENSFNGIVENRRSGAFSEHGLGLEIIKSIADELKGELVTEHDNKVFVTSVGVPLA